MSRTAWAAILALGCGHPPARPAQVAAPARASTADAGSPDAAIALDDDLPKLAQRAVDMYRGLQHAIESSADCAAATTALNALADSFADVIAANARVLHAGHDRVVQLRAALAPHEADIDAAAKAIAASKLLEKCSEDPGFAKVFERLVGEPS